MVIHMYGHHKPHPNRHLYEQLPPYEQYSHEQYCSHETVAPSMTSCALIQTMTLDEFQKFFKSTFLRQACPMSPTPTPL